MSLYPHHKTVHILVVQANYDALLMHTASPDEHKAISWSLDEADQAIQYTGGFYYAV